MIRATPVLACTALLALAACSTSRDTALAGSTPATPTVTERCDATGAQSLVGQAATADVVERARVAASAATVRTIGPDQMVTLEYLAGRLNLRVDKADVITAVDCG